MCIKVYVKLNDFSLLRRLHENIKLHKECVSVHK